MVVRRDLRSWADCGEIAETMQELLDDWSRLSIKVADLAMELESDPSFGESFDPGKCASPLPRAFQWLDASAYVNHVELVRQARGAVLPEAFWTDPLMYQGGSDGFLGPTQDIELPADRALGIDFEAEVALVLGDVPMGVSALDALDHVRLVMLANDVSLRLLIPEELERGFGFYCSKPAGSFSPCAVTPDELGDAWRSGKLHRPVHVSLNGLPFGHADAGVDMTFDFGVLIAHAAKSRPLGAGTIIGSGTVSNRLGGNPGEPVVRGGVGYSCIAEQRMVETIRDGKPATPFMRAGDRVRIEMFNSAGASIFGAIDQQVAPLCGVVHPECRQRVATRTA